MEFNRAIGEVERNIHTVGADVCTVRSIRFDISHFCIQSHCRVIGFRHCQFCMRERKTTTTEVKFLTIQHISLVLIPGHGDMQLIALRLHLIQLLYTNTDHALIITRRISHVAEAYLHHRCTRITLHVENEL